MYHLKTLLLILPIKEAVVNVPAVALTLPNICGLILLSFGVASLAQFLQMATGPGMIFRKYKSWLTYWFKFKPRERRTFQYLVRFGKDAPIHRYRPGYNMAFLRRQPYEYPKQTIITRRALWYSWFYKPLGGCIYCFSVWLATMFYIIGAVIIAAPFLITAFIWPLYIGVTYFFIELIESKIK